MGSNIVFLTVTPRGGPPDNLPRVACAGAWLPAMGFTTGALVQALPEPGGAAQYGGVFIAAIRERLGHGAGKGGFDG